MKKTINLIAIMAILLSFTGCNEVNTKRTISDVEAHRLITQQQLLILFRENSTKMLCLERQMSIQEIQKSVEKDLAGKGITSPYSSKDLYTSAYTLYPCPFSPYRNELRPVHERDITGVWLYPEISQKLRYGPNSPAWNMSPRIKCESIAYYKDGELRNMQVIGKLACPTKAKEMDDSRKLPRVSTWKLRNDGLVAVTRSDVKNHIEEWEMFIVEEAFSMSGIQFAKGDLLTYLRRVNGNDYNAATAFRHLTRLE